MSFRLRSNRRSQTPPGPSSVHDVVSPGTGPSHGSRPSGVTKGGVALSNWSLRNLNPVFQPTVPVYAENWHTVGGSVAPRVHTVTFSSIASPPRAKPVPRIMYRSAYASGPK